MTEVAELCKPANIYPFRMLHKKSYNSKVIWFTGLSGSGKTTLANHAKKFLQSNGIANLSLDGDNLRSGLTSDLDFTKKGRYENIRRAAEVAKLALNSELVVLASFITPLASDRKLAQQIIGKDDFIEVYVNCSLAVCEQRDIKGLYKRARAGEIKDFTGIDAPFESPTDFDLEVNTAINDLEACKKKLDLALDKWIMII